MLSQTAERSTSMRYESMSVRATASNERGVAMLVEVQARRKSERACEISASFLKTVVRALIASRRCERSCSTLGSDTTTLAFASSSVASLSPSRVRISSSGSDRFLAHAVREASCSRQTGLGSSYLQKGRRRWMYHQRVNKVLTQKPGDSGPAPFLCSPASSLIERLRAWISSSQPGPAC